MQTDRRLRDRLPVLVQALETALDAMREGDIDAIDSAVRIAEQLIAIGESGRFPAIEAASSRIPGTNLESTIARTADLLDRLRELGRGEDSPDSTILVVEDDPMTVEILKAELEGEHQKVLVAGTADEARGVLQDATPSLILLDLILPDADGRTLLSELRNSARTTTIPVIVLSGKVSDHTYAECLALGADDVFQKPFDPGRVGTAVATRLQRVRDAERESRTDSLTGLPNRAAFSRAFDRAVSMAERHGGLVSVAILDVDRFKSVNDIYGHATGDKVLRGVAAILDTAMRKSDLAARWGGEEFVVLAPNTDRDGLVRALENIRTELKAKGFVGEDGGEPFYVSFSAGVYQVDLDVGRSAEEAIAHADHYLYLAKESGRDRILHAGTGSTGSSPRILVAEDDEIMSEIICTQLRTCGFDVVLVSDGESALNAAMIQPPALAVLDIRMPGVDGLEVLTRLRKHPACAAVPIIMLSGLGGEEDVVRGFEAGADDYLLKPFSPAELTVRVNRLLRRR